ncbi:NUDIX hydrolase [Halobacterium litoreum]|uniref:NUDIX hydrolase n=1 Tax=Halobacterium litoreum TaxID=2039234 RepID=A0ABD5NHH3_9EURY|nr:NUDIX domain-containing protein [Halobacterium litoreum]UHH12570.1 NUDIX domain-containing protein [Halobacterium litoreum]
MSAAGIDDPVGRQLAGLEREYGSFDVHTEETVVPRAAFTDCLRASEAGNLGGARVLVERDGSVLLVRYEHSPAVWDLPGGSTERGERLRETALARVEADAGVLASLSDVVRVVKQRFALVEGGDGVTGLWVFFEGEADDDALEPGDDVAEAAWFDAADLPDAVAPEVADLLG